MPRFGLATVRGSSMQPGLRDGQFLVIRYARAAASLPAVGSLVIVRLSPDAGGNSRPVAVKRLTRIETDGRLWVESDNTADVHRVDSWTVGALPPSALVATAVLRFPSWLSSGQRRTSG